MKSAARGFTIVEAIVTIAILGILTAIAVPSFVALINNNRLSSSANEMLAAMMLARTEALRSARQVVVCKSTDSSSCNAGATWIDGWIVFVDDNANGAHDAGETLLRAGQGAKGVTGSGEGGAENAVAFTPRGALRNGGTPKIVFSMSGQSSRELVFSPMGRVSIQVGSTYP